MKKLLNRQSQPTETFINTFVRAKDRFEDEAPALTDLEKSFFGDVTSLGALEEIKHDELPPGLTSPEAKFKKY